MCCLRLSNLPPMSDLKVPQNSLFTLLCQRAGVCLITTSPPRSFPPTGSNLFWSVTLLRKPAGVWSKSTAGQHRGTRKADQSTHWGRAELDVISRRESGEGGVVCARGRFFPATSTLLLGRLEKAHPSSSHSSFCQHAPSLCQMCTWKHTLNGVKKGKELWLKNQKLTHLVVSHKVTCLPPPTTFNFLSLVASTTLPPSPQKNPSLWDCQLSRNLLRSVLPCCCSCSVLWSLW